MPNKGEWGEPYAALKILGEGKLHVADEEENCGNEWMTVLELIRHETQDRIVTYRYQENNVDIDIYVNGDLKISVPARDFLDIAETLSRNIIESRGRSVTVSETVGEFLHRIEMEKIKARSVDKSDIFLTVQDPRAGVTRRHIGYSIKSEFGNDPTLFNTAKASAVVYRLIGADERLENEVNNIVDVHGHVAVGARCEKIKEHCRLEFVGFPIAQRAGCAAFEENLDLLDSRLKTVIEQLLWNHFFKNKTEVDISKAMEKVIDDNPCGLTRPEIKYPYMVKSFLYAVYCGMTASTLWDGKSEVNGGFIKVKENGEVLAHYALESDAFKSYLYNNCYLECPSTDESHGNYAKIYEEDGEYYFRLNFQIRYR